MIETPDIRLKRLKMRSWRRGMKEMDLILGPFSDVGLAELSASDLDLYEEMLDENDQELYRWFSGQVDAPKQFFPLVEHLKAQTSFTG
jgi:antitoxin CptB